MRRQTEEKTHLHWEVEISTSLLLCWQLSPLEESDIDRQSCVFVSMSFCAAAVCDTSVRKCETQRGGEVSSGLWHAMTLRELVCVRVCAYTH